MTGDPRLPPGFRLERHPAVASTNALALERARAGEPAGLWILADRQTAGRGRQGRPWASAPGNLFASLLLRDPAPPARLGELPLVVAVAVHDAVADVLPPPARAGLAIKWPNDLLLGGAKLAGILIEGVDGPEGRAVVIGVGVNCTAHPDGTPYPATDLGAAGHPTDAVALFERLAERVALRLAAWRDGPFAALREAWLARAHGIGGPVTLRLLDRTAQGRFDGLDAAGRLLLRHDDGRVEPVSAGDVFFGRSAS